MQPLRPRDLCKGDPKRAHRGRLRTLCAHCVQHGLAAAEDGLGRADRRLVTHGSRRGHGLGQLDGHRNVDDLEEEEEIKRNEPLLYVHDHTIDEQDWRRGPGRELHAGIPAGVDERAGGVRSQPGSSARQHHGLG